MKENQDIRFMQRALQLAKLGQTEVAPNPMVGAVIVYQDKIIGEGYHKRYGEAHAEVNAIHAVKDKNLLSESTIYVTLEPCSHQGKTPPCADLIVQHQLKRVVIACLDSNSKVAGKGVKRLQDAGIEVTTGILEDEARHLNRRFFTFHEEKRPYVILKWAETKDGFLDRLPEERNQGINWITHPRLKLYVHKWRSTEQAIMVGWKTINNDDPQLNVRKLVAPSPHRFILDPHGKSNPQAKVFTDGGPTTIFSKLTTIEGLPSSVEIISLKEFSVRQILTALYERKYLSVFIEGGAQTLKHFIEENLWDEAFQLIGNVEFKRGIEAPILTNKVLVSSEKVEEDFIEEFRRRR